MSTTLLRVRYCLLRGAIDVVSMVAERWGINPRSSATTTLDLLRPGDWILIACFISGCYRSHRILLRIIRRTCTILYLLLYYSSLCRRVRAGWTSWSLMGSLFISWFESFRASESWVTKWLTLSTKLWQGFIHNLLLQSDAIGQDHINRWWQDW